MLLAQFPLETHSRGIITVAGMLRDSGMEVIYTGLRQTPEQIVATVVQESIDVLCLSVLSGAHDYLFPRIMELMRRENMQNVVVLGGGVIPEEDVQGLIQMGISGIYGPGTSTEIIAATIREEVMKRRKVL